MRRSRPQKISSVRRPLREAWREGGSEHFPMKWMPVHRRKCDQIRSLARFQIRRRGLAAFADQVEADLLTFNQRIHARAFNGGDVYKNVLAAVARLNEAVALHLVEPLHS